MLKFALVAFLPAVFAGWAISAPGPHRGSEGIGAGLVFIGIGIVAASIAKRSNSPRPTLWAAVAFAASIGLAFLGQGQ
jgi:hypothetical protein